MKEAVPTPGEHIGSLSGVAAVSDSDVWAVGHHTNAEGKHHPLAVRWDGTAWNVVRTPSRPTGAALEDVAAFSSEDVWAVGATPQDWPEEPQRPIVLHWNGTDWSIVPTPEIEGGWLTAVAGSAADDVWAVGGRYYTPKGDTVRERPMVLHWDGSAWRVVRFPNPDRAISNHLSDVTVLDSTPTVVGLFSSGSVGSYIRHWDGSAWQQSWVGEPAQLIHSISDIGWAIGTSGEYRYHEARVLALRGGVGGWSGVPALELFGELPAVDGAFVQPWLGDVTGTSGADVWVAGGWHREVIYKINPFVAHWVDGTGWNLEEHPLRHGRLHSMDAVPFSSEVWGVGGRGVNGRPISLHRACA